MKTNYEIVSLLLFVLFVVLMSVGCFFVGGIAAGLIVASILVLILALVIHAIYE